MKIIVTGSLGHISKPLTETLVQQGHDVTVVSSKADRQAEIEELGAKAAIGSVADADFLTATFTGADAVYTMVPPPGYFNPELDLAKYTRDVAECYVKAIALSGVKKVVHLSSIGAHMAKGNGILALHHEGELIFDKLTDVDITFMRPTGFYYNLFSFIPMIKQTGQMAAAYGADEILTWVSPKDIAEAVAKELVATGTHRKVVYVASDELTGNETARILGEAIGIPDLKWILISEKEMADGLAAVGMKADIAAGLAEMFAAQNSGLLTEDFYRHKPELGKVKVAEFAKDFAAVYHQK